MSDWEEKVAFLVEMFPSLSDESLEHILKDLDKISLDEAVERCLAIDKQPQEEKDDTGAFSMVSLVPQFGSKESEQSEKKDVSQSLDVTSLDAKHLDSKKEEKLRQLVKDLKVDEVVSLLKLDTSTNGSLRPLITALKTLLTCVENLFIHEGEEKYRRICISNPKFSSKVSILPGWFELLTGLGFQPVEKDSKKFVVLKDGADAALLRVGHELLQQELQRIQPLPTAPTPAPTPSEPTSKALIPPAESGETGVNDTIYQRKKTWTKPKKRTQTGQALQEKTRRRTPEEMASIAARLAKGERKREGRITAGRVGDFNRVKKARDEIKKARGEKHDKWRNTKLGRKRMYTVSDIEALRQSDMDASAKFGTGALGSASFAEMTKIGKEALELTNKFRKENGLPPLMWHQALAEIGYVHSKNMGDKKAKFSHDGFNERVKQYPFQTRSAAENLAWNQGLPNVAKVSVDGWIDSPGHRKNLLSNHNYCGIGVYRNSSGAYYLTQLFGLA